jgi:hypothetical protein
MKQFLSAAAQSRWQKIVLLASILMLVYWWFAQRLNVYEWAVVGAIYEMLWLPMVVLVFLLPVMALVQCFIAKRPLLPVLALILNCITILIIMRTA